MVAVLAPDDVFGERVLIDDHPRDLTAVAVEPTVLAEVDRYLFLFLVDESPKFALDIMGALATRLRNYDNWVASLESDSPPRFCALSPFVHPPTGRSGRGTEAIRSLAAADFLVSRQPELAAATTDRHSGRGATIPDLHCSLGAGKLSRGIEAWVRNVRSTRRDQSLLACAS